MPDQARLKYNSGNSTVDLTVLEVHGAAEPDSLTKFPGIIHEMLDGSLSSQNAGSRRNITIKFQVMTSANLRKAVDWWAADDAPQIVCLASAPTVTPSEVSGNHTATTGYYYVMAIDPVGYSAKSSKQTINLSAFGGASLVWPSITSARGYKVFRKLDSGNWFVFDYTTNLYYNDIDKNVVAFKDLGSSSDSIVPSAASTINVVTEGDFQLDWAFDTELGRILTVNVRETSIFLKAAGFPI